MLTQERLKELVHYDPATGLFTWRVARPKCRVGGLVGSTDSKGYLRARIDYVEYRLHRLAVLYMVGEFPALEVDHKNLVRADNRWENLRLATGSQNQHNKGTQRNNTSGFVGVSFFRRTGTWRARCKVKGREVSLGYYKTAELAASAVSAARERLHGEFARRTN
jgi:hypothetical protein